MLVLNLNVVLAWPENWTGVNDKNWVWHQTAFEPKLSDGVMSKGYHSEPMTEFAGPLKRGTKRNEAAQYARRARTARTAVYLQIRDILWYISRLRLSAARSMEPQLSIVIPAYNEAARIGPSLESILSFLSARQKTAEVIVVNDGSTDGTVAVVTEHIPQYDKAGFALRVVTNNPNRGKGYSVKRGVREACGEVVLFTDADLSSPITEAPKLIDPILKKTADVAFGSRALDRSLIGVHQSKLRELRGQFSNLLIRVVSGLPFKDTQCGFKAFRRASALPSFIQQRSEGFGFDPELLFIARKHGLRLIEVPVVWNHCEGSKVGFFMDTIECLLDLFAIRVNNLLGRYPTPGSEAVSTHQNLAAGVGAAATASQSGRSANSDDPPQR